PQLTLELKAIHARQAYIEKQARRLGGGRRLQERFRRRKTLHAKSHGLEQIIKRISQRVVIVDHHYEWRSGHPGPPFSLVALLANRRRLPSAHDDARSPCRGRTCSSVTAYCNVTPAGESVYHPLGKAATTLGGGGRADQLF